MDKAAAVRALAAAGVLVSPELLGNATAEQLEQLLKKKPGQLFVTALAEPLALRVERAPSAGDAAVADLVQAYQRKFERLRDLLLRRPELQDAVSLASMSGRAAGIGMVRELTGTGFVLEDPTGTVEVVLPESTERPDIDDVIAVRGEMRGQQLVASELLFPDVPLPKQLPAVQGELLLGVPGPLSFLPITSVAWARLGALTIVSWEPPTPLTERAAIRLLRKRWLPLAPRPGPIEPALLEPVPDILWLRCDPPWTATYKGVTLIASQGASIDLATLD